MNEDNRDHTGTDSGTVELEVAFDYDLINDLMIACREGGSNYWADLRWKSDEPAADTTEVNMYLWVREVIDDWVTPIEYGKEDAITRYDYWRAMQQAVHPSTNGLHRKYKAEIASMLMGADVDWDVVHADAILQVAMFGEVVYG